MMTNNGDAAQPLGRMGSSRDGSPPVTHAPAAADQARIEQLKRAIEAGEYPIDERLIAEKIIAQGALDDLN